MQITQVCYDRAIILKRNKRYKKQAKYIEVESLRFVTILYGIGDMPDVLRLTPHKDAMGGYTKSQSYSVYHAKLLKIDHDTIIFDGVIMHPTVYSVDHRLKVRVHICL